MINCLSKTFIKYHFSNINIHTNTHNQKKTNNQVSPKGIAAYFTSKSKIGDHFAKYNEKKNKNHNMIMKIHNFVLFNITVFFDFLYFLLLATTKNISQ